MKTIACSWSGGKDSCFALMSLPGRGESPLLFLNMMNENGKISRSHGLPLSILQQQATLAGATLLAIPTSWDDYRSRFISALLRVKNDYGADDIVFGDIDLDAHRAWEEEVCREAGMTAHLPLWKEDRRQLVFRMIHSGMKATIVSCNETMGPDFLGREINADTIELLDRLDVDVCGENGEFHTVVTSCPLFSGDVRLPAFERVKHESYWFVNWLTSPAIDRNGEGQERTTV